MNREASPRTGVLIPVPCYNKTVLSITQLGAVTVPYYLSEEQGWALQVEELQRALESAKGVCSPVALYVINPGNPAGIYSSQCGDRLLYMFGLCVTGCYLFLCHTACRLCSEPKISARGDPVCLGKEALSSG